MSISVDILFRETHKGLNLHWLMYSLVAEDLLPMLLEFISAICFDCQSNETIKHHVCILLTLLALPFYLGCCLVGLTFSQDCYTSKKATLIL